MHLFKFIKGYKIKIENTLRLLAEILSKKLESKNEKIPYRSAGKELPDSISLKNKERLN
jgi:hypothetical protein